MCDQCVIDSVSERLLSRRSVLKAAAVAPALIAAGPEAQAAKPALGAPLDLSHDLYSDFPTYSGESQFTIARKFTYAKHRLNLNVVTMSEHTGTHLDAPLHFSESGHAISDIPADTLVVALAVVDIRHKAQDNPDAQVTPEDLKAWISANGPLPRKCCVAMNSGWAARVSSSATFRNADDTGRMHFPGFHAEAAKMLIEDGGAVGIAVDTLSLDHGPSRDFATHYAWLPTNRWGIEAIANLDQVPAKGAMLVVGAMKIRGGTGTPCRAFAFL